MVFFLVLFEISAASRVARVQSDQGVFRAVVARLRQLCFDHRGTSSTSVTTYVFELPFSLISFSWWLSFRLLLFLGWRGCGLVARMRVRRLGLEGLVRL